MATAEGGFVRLNSQQVIIFLFCAVIAAGGWIYQGERQRIDRLEITVQSVIPADMNTIRADIASVKADIAALKAQGASAQITLDRIDRRLETLTGVRP